ncbi:unnamed protein product [Adineta steineri]|uniref:SnoaL-like domain-containing protein n=1 Tax=Adineta steineri TaxID=433720 RepID=A0A815S8U0_9BILA|nr:unnamed protein product [Adineta steineri]CAF1640809.1 unnamed protein product [Adineta steineri]
MSFVTWEQLEKTRTWIRAFYEACDSFNIQHWINEFFESDAIVQVANSPIITGHQDIINYFEQQYSHLSYMKHTIKRMDVLSERIYVHVETIFIIENDPEQRPIILKGLVIIGKKIDDTKLTFLNSYVGPAPFLNRIQMYIESNKQVAKVKAVPSDEHADQFRITFSQIAEKYVGSDSCIVEPDRKNHYSIYPRYPQANKPTPYFELSYQNINNEYHYRLTINNRLYQLESGDLNHRHLTIIDNIHSNTDGQNQLNRPETFCQVNDYFSKLNKIYHVNIEVEQWPLGYLAVIILLHLHESQRNVD